MNFMDSDIQPAHLDTLFLTNSLEQSLTALITRRVCVVTGFFRQQWRCRPRQASSNRVPPPPLRSMQRACYCQSCQSFTVKDHCHHFSLTAPTGIWDRGSLCGGASKAARRIYIYAAGMHLKQQQNASNLLWILEGRHRMLDCSNLVVFCCRDAWPAQAHIFSARLQDNLRTGTH